MIKITRPFRVNEAHVRGVALQVFILAVITILSGSLLPLLILVVDFGTRLFLSPQFSLLAYLSKKAIAPLLRFKKKMILFQPKRFAAGIGFTMSLTALLLGIHNQEAAVLILMSMLAVFSALEAFLKFCMGCKIFSLLIKLGLADEDLCTDCYFNDGAGI